MEGVEKFELPEEEKAGESRDSLTQEDLLEAIRETIQTLEILLERSDMLILLIKREMDERTTHAPYKFDKELKFVAHRIARELYKAIVILYPSFPQPQKELLDFVTELQKTEKVDFTNEAAPLRICTNISKEILLTSFFISKLQEVGGQKVTEILKGYVKNFHFLVDFASRFPYLVPDILIQKIPGEVFSYAVELMRDGGVKENLYEYERAK